MKTKDGQVGDLTPEFALSTFFPQRLQKPVQVLSELCFAFFNMCGFVNCVRNYLARAPDQALKGSKESAEKPPQPSDDESSPGKPSKDTPSKRVFKPGFVGGPDTPGAQKKKKALDFLDEQIKNNLNTSINTTFSDKKVL